jgi:mannosyltransferase OCH1-like enzyme
MTAKFLQFKIIILEKKGGVYIEIHKKPARNRADPLQRLGHGNPSRVIHYNRCEIHCNRMKGVYSGGFWPNFIYK